MIFSCPACERNLKVADEHAGKTVKCPCGQLMQVPATDFSQGASGSEPRAAASDPGFGVGPQAGSGAVPSNLYAADWTGGNPSDQAGWGPAVGSQGLGNPYAPTTMQMSRPGMGSDSLQRIRQEHIQHETSIKTMAVLYIIAAVFMLLGAMGSAAVTFAGMAGNAGDEVDVVVTGFLVFIYGGVGVALIVIALGLRKLRPWSQLAATITSALGLMGFPCGTIISVYFLWLLQSKKGHMVFSADYQNVIAATPGVKARTSTAAWVVLGLIVLAVVLAVGAAISFGG